MGYPKTLKEEQLQEDDYEYGLEQTYYQMKSTNKKDTLDDYTYVKIETNKNKNISDQGNFKGRGYRIYEKQAKLKNQELKYTYKYGATGTQKTPIIYNEQITGMTLLAEVEKTDKEEVKVNLRIDKGKNGDNIPALGGKYVGPWIKHFINVLAVVLLLLVGVVFVASPASLLTNISDELIRTGTLGASVVNDAEVISATGEFSKGNILIFWTTLIFLYYILATLLPIDKIIGKIYPYFGGLLMFMTFGMLFGLLFEGIPLFQTYGTDLSITDFFTNFYPAGEQAKNPIWPILFITVACGAVSGFHATQTPLMARCVENEKEARFVFYGAMITEGIIALIWCMVGVSFYDDRIALQEAIAAGSPSKVVYDSAISMLGWFGGLLAILGVVILPITSGDTAFRAARLIISDFLNYSQKKLTNRLVISIPLFVVGFIVSKIDFSILWRYFGWANQATAAVTLWIAAAYLLKMRKLHWICTIPAMFMTMVCATYLFFAEIGFKLSYDVSVYCSMALTLVISVAFFLTIKPMSKEEIEKL